MGMGTTWGHLPGPQPTKQWGQRHDGTGLLPSITHMPFGKAASKTRRWVTHEVGKGGANSG